ncbi:MAG: hypothetical protein RL291_455 [Pseudomonadota bacterium]
MHVTEKPSLDLDAFLPYRLATVAHAMSRALAGVYEEKFGVTIPEWRVLANLGRRSMGAGELADASSLDKPAVTRALQRLEARGLVARETPEGDRRRAHLALTPKGRTLYRQIAGLALGWEAKVLADLSAADRKALDVALEKLKARLVQGEFQ